MKETKVGIYFGLLVFVFLLAACQTTKADKNDYYNYDHEQAEQAVSQLGFDLELPEFIPIEMVMMVSDVYEVKGDEALDISFYTEENDLLTMQFMEGEGEMELFSPEQVEITDSLTGLYVDNSYSKTVTWQKDGVTYKMTYRPSNFSDNDSEVEKSDLLHVARSFHF
ncbi:hypothetical protein [Thalassobacillus devorans]|uniref:hypothetical protein n=2 Tax=Thalassobacillus TaxID=331971 RepID=UPI000A1C8F65|nr:hypothetical protein [Thalassobacillus devorans]